MGTTLQRLSGNFEDDKDQTDDSDVQFGEQGDDRVKSRRAKCTIVPCLSVRQSGIKHLCLFQQWRKQLKLVGNGNNSHCVMLKLGMQRCAKDGFVNASEFECYSLMKLPSSSITKVLKTLAIDLHLLLTSFKDSKKMLFCQSMIKKKKRRRRSCLKSSLICVFSLMPFAQSSMRLILGSTVSSEEAV